MAIAAMAGLVIAHSQRPLVTEAEIAAGAAALSLAESREVSVRSSDWASCDDERPSIVSYLHSRQEGVVSMPRRALTAYERRWFERCRGLLTDVHEAAAAGQWMRETRVHPDIVVALVALSPELSIEQRFDLLLDVAGPGFYFSYALWDLWSALVTSGAPLPELEERLARMAQAAKEDDAPFATVQDFREISREFRHYQEQCDLRSSRPEEWLALMMEGLENPVPWPNFVEEFLADHLGGRFRRPCAAHMVQDVILHARSGHEEGQRLRLLAFEEAFALLLMNRPGCGPEEIEAQRNGESTACPCRAPFCARQHVRGE